MSGPRAAVTQRNQIPTTGRTPDFLARQYGYNSAKSFADAVPKNGLVIDVGAGLSRLGHYVASKRPDVRWVNADLFYCHPDQLAQASQQAPDNLEFIGGDVIAFSPELHALKGKADRVFSYWLMPHLSLHTVKLAERAAGTMWELLKPNGQLIVGPIRGGWFHYKHALRFSKQTSKTEVARILAEATRLHWVPRKIQALGNRYNIHVGNHLLAALHWWQAKREPAAYK